MRISDSRYDIKPADQSQDTKLLLHGYLIGEIEQDRTDLLGMSRQQMFTYVNSKVYRYVAEKKLAKVQTGSAGEEKADGKVAEMEKELTMLRVFKEASEEKLKKREAEMESLKR